MNGSDINQSMLLFCAATGVLSLLAGILYALVQRGRVRFTRFYAVVVLLMPMPFLVQEVGQARGDYLYALWLGATLSVILVGLHWVLLRVRGIRMREWFRTVDDTFRGGG